MHLIVCVCVHMHSGYSSTNNYVINNNNNPKQK